MNDKDSTNRRATFKQRVREICEVRGSIFNHKEHTMVTLKNP